MMSSQSRSSSSSSSSSSGNNKKDENENEKEEETVADAPVLRRRSTRRSKKVAVAEEVGNTNKNDEEQQGAVVTTTSTTPKKKRTTTTKNEKKSNDNDDNENDDEESKPKSNKKRRGIKGTTTKTTSRKGKMTTVSSEKEIEDGSSDNDSNASDDDNDEKKKKKKKAKKKKAAPPKHQVLTERDVLPKLWDDAKKAAANGSSYTFKIASWNVAGLRALLKKMPNVFIELVKRHDLDVLCIQEHKLQEIHLDDPKLNIRDTMQLASNGFDEHWSFSTAKKGYSGTAVFVRRRNSNEKQQQTAASSGKKQTTLDGFVVKKKKDSDEEEDEALPIDPSLLIPQNVSYVMGKDEHDAEGRIVMVDMPLFSFCNCYVPNSGQKLERLEYRTKQWDKDFVRYIQEHRRGSDQRPVFWLGDLNVAHTNLEVWNDGAKHLPKQAGVTPQERASFTEQMESAGYKDAFRYLHPTAAGHYSYWSGRAGNREPNKGLRLDYFICPDIMFDEQSSSVVVRDSYMDPEQMGSDHCPVILELEIKPPTNN